MRSVTDDDSSSADEGFGTSMGASSGDCPAGLDVTVDVGSDVAIVSGDSCPTDGGRCEPMVLRRQEPRSSEWYGSCPEGKIYSIAWIVPA